MANRIAQPVIETRCARLEAALLEIKQRVDAEIDEDLRDGLLVSNHLTAIQRFVGEALAQPEDGPVPELADSTRPAAERIAELEAHNATLAAALRALADAASRRETGHLTGTNSPATLRAFFDAINGATAVLAKVGL